MPYCIIYGANFPERKDCYGDQADQCLICEMEEEEQMFEDREKED